MRFTDLFTSLLNRPVRTSRSGKARTRTSRLRFERLEERAVPAIFCVTNTLDDGSVGSLRWAITQVNADTDPVSTIDFNISGTGAQTIYVSTALPTITHPVVIDGTTQPGYTATSGPQIVLTTSVSGFDGLDITAGNSTVKGLDINSFSDGSAGIALLGNGGDTIEGCYIGTDPTGTIAMPNSVGVLIASNNNTIGGASPGAGNVISSNAGSGVLVDSGDDSILGNSIDDNTGPGIYLKGSSNDTIGGAAPGAGNVISSNAGDGILVDSSATGDSVIGNTIKNNTVWGICLNSASDNTIGGATTAAGNVISSNAGDGVLVEGGARGDTILSNSISDNGGTSIFLDSSTDTNDNQAAPVLTSFGGTEANPTVSGTMNSLADTTFLIQFFAGDNNNASSGETFLGSTCATTDSTGFASFSSTSLAAIPSGEEYLGATATVIIDDDGSYSYSDTSIFSSSLVLSNPSLGSSFTVDTTQDNTSPGSLRWAIDQVNADTQPLSTISFDIPGASAQTIGLTTPLPGLMKPVVINGYTQPGSSPNTLADGENAVLNIVLDGSQTVDCDGLDIAGGNSTVEGLQIQNFQDNGIQLLSDASDTVAGNVIENSSHDYVNPSPNSTLLLAGGGEVYIDNCANNIIGGTTLAARNELTNFDWMGILIEGPGADNNQVEGDFIGTDGSQDLAPNGLFTIAIDDASNNTIGGTVAGSGNVIVGTGYWVSVEILGDVGSAAPASENAIQGNFLGTNAAGTTALVGGALDLVGLDGDVIDTTIGGASANARNVVAPCVIGGISVGANYGVLSEIAPSGTDIESNLIGLNAASTGTLENLPPDGIGIDDNMGDCTIEDNTITGCAGDGLVASGSGLIENNTIYGNGGTGLYVSGNAGAKGGAIEGNTIYGNSGNGISVSTGNQIVGNSIYDNSGSGISDAGTSVQIEENSIYDNGGAGVLVEGTGDQIEGNSIYGNGDLGVEPGGYNLQNYPTLLAAQSGSTTTVLGTLNSAPCTTYTLDFYGNTTADPSGHGQGQYYLGANTITTDANGNASFLITLPTSTYAGEVISATATDPNGNTSEFSEDVTATAPATNLSGNSFVLSGGAAAGSVDATLNGSSLPAFDPIGTLQVEGSTGEPDTYTVNFGSTLTSPISIAGGGTNSGDTLIVNGDDSDDSDTNFITKTPSDITWGSPVTETIYRSGIPNTTINANGTSNNYINDPGGNTIINGGPGTNTITITATTSNGVVVNGGPGVNYYDIDLGSLAAPVTIDDANSTATNNLTVIGATGNNTVIASGSQVTSGSQTVNIDTPLASATIDGGSGNNQITVDALTVPVQSLTVTGGGGTNTITLDNVGSDVAAVAVSGGTGSSVVQVQGTPPANLKTQDLTPGPVAQVAFGTAPESNFAGFILPAAVEVYIEDASGDLETTNNSTVKLAIAAGPSDGTFTSGSVTSVAAVNGIATFSSLAFTLSGTYTLKATDGSLTTATATVAIQPNTGILLLDPTGNSLNVSGNAALNVTDDGAIYLDSSSASAVAASGNASITAAELDVKGGVSTSGNAAVHGVINKGATVLADPLANLAAPALPTNQFSASSYSGTLQPGTYVGGITVSGNNAVTLVPGIYYLKGGGLTVSGNATVTGTDVMLYITGLTGSSPTSINISGNADVTLTPLTSGTYQGIVIFQDRTSTAAIDISGNACLNTTGTEYAPGATVALSGNEEDDNPTHTSLGAQWIVANLALSGNATFTLTADANNRSDDPNAMMVAGGPKTSSTPVALLTEAEAKAALKEALTLWQAAGLSAGTLLALERTTVAIEPLPAPYLGMASPGAIYLDSTAEGYGWFTSTSLKAVPPSGAVDLLTVVSHELGHLFGLMDDDGAPLMAQVLAPGIRILPDAGDLKALHASLVVSRATPQGSGQLVASTADEMARTTSQFGIPVPGDAFWNMMTFTTSTGGSTAALDADATVSQPAAIGASALIGGSGLDWFFVAVADTIEHRTKGEIVSAQ